MKVRDKAKFKEIYELGYDIYSKPKARRGGGVALVFKSGLLIKQVKTDKCVSFEVTEASMIADSERLWFSVVYRLGTMKPQNRHDHISGSTVFYPWSGLNLMIIWLLYQLIVINLSYVVISIFICKIIRTLMYLSFLLT